MIDKPFYQNMVAKTSCNVRKCFLGVGRLHKAFQPFSIEDVASSSIYSVLPDTFLDGFRITLACVGEDLQSFRLCLKFRVPNAFCIPIDTLFILGFFLIRLGSLAVGGLASLLFAIVNLGGFDSNLHSCATLFRTLSLLTLTSETSAVIFFGFAFAFTFAFVAEGKEMAMTMGSTICLLEQEARSLRSQSTETFPTTTKKHLLDWDSQQKFHVVLIVIVIVMVDTSVVVVVRPAM